MARLMPMHYVDFIAFLERSEKDWEYILQKTNYEPSNAEPVLEFAFDSRQYFEPTCYRDSDDSLCFLKLYQTAIILIFA